MCEISFKDVIIKSGLWNTLQNRNAEKIIYAVKDRFVDTGRFDAFKCNWMEGMENKPHFFWDSDVAKWIEGVSYSMINGANRELEPFVDDIVDLIGKHRQEDGYFNIYYTVCEKGMQWTNRYNHELYCAGHLIEAAIAYKHATGKDAFLRYMIDYAECIYKVFIQDKSAAFTTPGHQEIELALVKLYEETDNKKYLELAEFFLDSRGDKNNNDCKNNETYEQRASVQSHLPVRKQMTAEGHAVRACYMYSAMADLAIING
ncbi:MAG: glycoside hydrolase family 127 protein, partial [Clostridia bacterium]|nr:glycoside hydrolase family 127 protein [Clostridia bacterium]